jgi:ureidoglycolate dehydrogenase (NAD+)
MPRVSAPALARVMRGVLSARGVCAASVDHVVESLVQTSLRGVDSHGIQLFPHYCRVVETERVNKNPAFAIQQSASATAILDADHGFGHHAGAAAIDHAIGCAKEVGIACVAVKNSTHFGAAAYFALRAPARGCIGFAFTNADALIKAHGAKAAFTGTNPICFTAPIDGEEPFCLDMATSFVSWNKIVNHRRTGQPIPDDWACDADGLPVRDPTAARTLQPAGEHKGFGLSMIVDILCALLAGGAISKDLLPMYQHLEVRRAISHFFLAIDIDRFSPIADFAARMRAMADRARAMTPLDPAVPVMVAGDPEKRSCAMRTQNGIPIDEAKLEEFLALSSEFSDARIE